MNDDVEACMLVRAPNGPGIVREKATKCPGNYNKDIAEHNEKIKTDNLEREKRIEKTTTQEKSWELIREIREFIRMHSK